MYAFTIIAQLVVHIWFVCIAWSFGVWWGIGCLFCPPLQIVFGIKYFHDVKKVFLLRIAIAIFLAFLTPQRPLVDSEPGVSTEIVSAISKVHKAAQEYKKINSEFPEELYELQSLLEPDDIVYATDSDFLYNGYYFEYVRSSNKTYELIAVPEKSSNLKVYSDQEELLKINNVNGELIEFKKNEDT